MPGHAVPRGRAAAARTENFYYAQEDELFAAAERDGLHLERAPLAHGHRLRRRQRDEHGPDARRRTRRSAASRDRRFVFPGSETQWNGLTDMTDAGLLAEQMLWAATDAGRRGRGVQHRQRRRLPLALAVAAARRVLRRGVGGLTTTRRGRWSSRWPTPAPVWARIVRRRTASSSPTSTGSRRGGTPTATSAGTWSAFTDMARSRAAGFTGYRSTLACFLELFDRLEAERVVPRPA